MLRVTRRSNELVDINTIYNVIIDDIYYGYIMDGQTIYINVPEGKHTIYLEVNKKLYSNKLEIYKKNNEVLEIECGIIVDLNKFNYIEKHIYLKITNISIVHTRKYYLKSKIDKIKR